MFSPSCVFIRAWRLLSLFGLCAVCGMLVKAASFDNSRNNNLAVYWGQDSAGNQQRLSYYCQDSTYDAIPLAFLYDFFGPGDEPITDFANICSNSNDPVYSGTSLANCSFLGLDIQECQSKGKIVTLSLGGATGAVGFANDSQAESFADQIWDSFLGGSSDIRPFGDAVLDGVDLDIEGGSQTGYAAFVTRIQSNAKGASKKYYFTAAPQCPFPDENLDNVLNSAPFDAVYVQFYNNYCGLNNPDQFNFGVWDQWAQETSPNKDIKVYIGAPGDPQSAGQGYVDLDTLRQYALQAQATYVSFGGVMLWDASSAYSNDRYDLGIKEAMVSGPSIPVPSIVPDPTVSTTVSLPSPTTTGTSGNGNGNGNGSGNTNTTDTPPIGIGAKPHSGHECVIVDYAGQYAAYEAQMGFTKRMITEAHRSLSYVTTLARRHMRLSKRLPEPTFKFALHRRTSL